MRAKFTRVAANISAVGTLLQVHAANAQRSAKVVDFGIYGQGVDNLGKPLHMQLVIQTSAGTGGGTNTPVKLSREDSNTIEATGLDDTVAWSGQPTDSSILHEWYWHPQGGSEKPIVPVDGTQWEIGSNERVALRVMEAPGATVKATCYIEIAE